MILDRKPQFAVEFIKKLNEMLGIEMKLLAAFYLQTNKQTERTNQKLEQYLRMYINYRQNNWSKQLATIEFAFNNKIHTVTKSSPFKVNYGQELRMGFEIKKKRKHMKVKEFVKEIKKIHKEVKVTLKKLQEEMKEYIDKNRIER